MWKQWQDAWMIVRTELIRFKLGIAFTLVFSAYMAVCTISMVDSAVMMASGELEEDADFVFLKGVLDFLMLTLIPNFGFVFNRRGLRYWTEDSYRKQIVKLRTLPIDMKTIVLSRYMMMGLMTFTNSIIFFTIQYLFIPEIKEILTLVQFLVYALVLIVYAVIMHTVYVMFEWTMSGKKYMWTVFIIMFGYLDLATLLAATGNSLFLTIIELVTNWPTATCIVSLLLLIQAFPLGMRLSFRTLSKSDLI